MTATLRRSSFPTPPGPAAHRNFTETRQTSPARSVITDSDTAEQLAVFTDGARTVTHLGPTRSFTEQIPIDDLLQDEFARTVAAGWGTTLNAGRWTIRSSPVDDAEFYTDGTAPDTPGWGNIDLTTVNESRRIAPASYGYNYAYSDTTVLTKADQLAIGDDIYTSVMFGYADTSNHYLATLDYGRQREGRRRLHETGRRQRVGHRTGDREGVGDERRGSGGLLDR